MGCSKIKIIRLQFDISRAPCRTLLRLLSQPPPPASNSKTIKLLIRLGTKRSRCTCMWLEAETDVSGSGRKLLRDRNETLPKLHCTRLLLLDSMVFHGVRLERSDGITEQPFASTLLLLNPQIQFSVSLQVLHWHGIRAAKGCASGSRFQHFGFMVKRSYIAGSLLS